jgi:hypothetical protein
VGSQRLTASAIARSTRDTYLGTPEGVHLERNFLLLHPFCTRAAFK